MQSAGDLDVQYVCQERGTLGELEEVLLVKLKSLREVVSVVELESLGEEVLLGEFRRGVVVGRVGEEVLLVELESLGEEVLLGELGRGGVAGRVGEFGRGGVVGRVRERWCCW